MLPFQLGVITDEISPDFERALDVMLEYKVRQVEIRELWGKNVLQHDSETLNRARAAVQKRGMAVCSIASPFYKCSLPQAAQEGGRDFGVERKMHGATEVQLEEQMDLLRHACELAHFFGAPLVRVFSFWRETEMTPEIFELVRAAFEEPIELAKREGLILGMENEHACMLGTGVETAPFLKAVNSPHLRCVWDPGNAFFAGENPYPDGYNLVKDYVSHVHVKDGRRVSNGDGKVKYVWTVVGEGEIDYHGQFSALLADGYQGVVSLETHYRNSEGNLEQSSRECLEGIQRILEHLDAS